MNRIVTTGLAGVLLTVAAAGATTLRYTLKAGDEWKYRNVIAAEGTLTIAGPLGAQPIPVKVNADETRTLKVSESAGEGWFWMESKQVKGTLAAVVGGEAMGQGAEAMPPLNYKMKMNAKGDVSELETIKPAEANAQASIDLNLGQITALAELTGFPEGDVAAGATWDKEIPIKTKDGKTLTAKVSNKLISVNDNEAKIATTYDMPIPPTEGTLKMGMDIPIRIEGHALGTSVVIWDIAKSCVLRSEGNSTMDVKLYLVGLSTEPAIGKFLMVIKGELVQ
ncbi:MAG: hypothetical protein HZB16_14040 [Armatimonadetes bacterium]|nr:hypothetical protein [Armatimonadota bacterium]